MRAATGVELDLVARSPVPLESARGNCESLVGFAQVPLGLAGPLAVDTTAGRREVYVPMATNEGALVASHTRGMRLLAAAGGARSRVVREGLTQAPIFVYADAERALAARARVLRGEKAFAKLVAGTTRHGKLVRVRADVVGRRLVVELTFTTGDAIGINMAARATELVAARIAKTTGALEHALHGQDVEKRANSRATYEGRGRSVVCDATIPRDALAALARTTPEDLRALWHTYQVGFARLGTQNQCVQSANGLAAVLLACGQDVAYLPECATGFLDLDVSADGALYASVTLPSLLVGTVGGGSQKGTAVEGLRLLGCAGDGGANTFAELLGAVVLAGDLSLMAAFATHEFVAAHEKLGRNRPR
ncbi:MAG: 3-hydroxy-3-methylglutaryl-CoA reductase [Planctomycetes bacterium]|nr:3-hydroxy-3-methylglutaryl-CoA reductase [Planctomycetota bacterium]